MAMNQPNWQQKLTVKKGNLGEEIISRFLERKGYVIYSPETKDKAHAFDRLAIKDKEQIIIAEIKTKARRNKYADTGIDKRNYDQYVKIQNKYNIPVFIFFVDEMLKKVYGNWLSKLIIPIIIEGKQYPLILNNIIYFPLVNMINIAELSEQQITELKKLSNRNYEYIAITK